MLLKSFTTPYESFPFQEISAEEFKPAIQQLIKDTLKKIEEISQQPDTPTYANTIEELEYSGNQLNIVSEAFFNLCSAETNDILEKDQEEISMALAKYSNDIALNQTLFNRIQQVVSSKEEVSELNAEELRLLDKTYKGFTRNGALLSEVDKEQLRTIDQDLAAQKVKFSQNVLQDTNSRFLHIEDISLLEGLPTSNLSQAKEAAADKDMEGFIFTLQYPSYMPFMTYVKNRSLREEMYLLNGKKAFSDNEYNNEATVKQIVTLRLQRANLLGYEHHAAFVLEERMAKSKEEVSEFLNTLLEKSKPLASQEIQQLKQLAQKDGIEDLKPYDHAYYAELLRKSLFDINDEELKPFFTLDNTLKACFRLAEQLYGLNFKLRNDIQKYHKEVDVYEVKENGQYKALFYTDFFPRKGKRAGAWMTSYRGQYVKDGTNHRPHISIVCNFNRPTEKEPSLLTFDEVVTLFHEFGHALHGILADTVYESLSGTNVSWDFVELPSQFLENYCFQKEFLNTFAFHYGTGALLPEDKIDKIVLSANFMEAYQTVRQVSFGLLDMAYHGNKAIKIGDLEHFEKQILAPTQLYPSIPGINMSSSFSHIFSGGYSSGYYSYKWSEVLDADAFAYFKENGIFNKQTASKFKILLSKGDTIPAMDLFVSFRGRKPKVDALLKRAGLTA